jgi:hypothetical protein
VGLVELPELASSLALRLPTCWVGRRWEAFGPPLSEVTRLLADTNIFFFRVERAILSSLKRAGEISNVEIVFLKANAS